MFQSQLQAAHVPEPLEPLLATPEGTLWGLWTHDIKDRLEQIRGQHLTAVCLGTSADMAEHRDVMTTSAPLQDLDAMLAGAQRVRNQLRAGARIDDVFDGEVPEDDVARLRMSDLGAPGPRDWARETLQVGSPGEPLAIAVIDAPGWQVSARFRIGGFNDHPRAFAHAGVLAWWVEAWEARVLTVTQSLVEVDVGRRPDSVAEAMALASEHHVYCPGVVAGSNLMAYGQKLRGQAVWSFGW